MIITNRKAQALAFVFLTTVATGQAQAEQGVTSKVDVVSINNAAGAFNAKADMQVGNSCGGAHGSTEVKAKAINNAAGAFNAKANMKIGTINC